VPSGETASTSRAPRHRAAAVVARVQASRRERARGRIVRATYDTATSVWATRGEHCCVASILEFFTPPTDAQIEDVARLCDETS
jgi:hypothetical protein